MDKIISVIKTALNIILIAAVATVSVLTITLSFLGAGNEANTILNAIFTMLLFLALGAGLIVAILLKKDKAAKGLAVVFGALNVLTIMLGLVPFDFEIGELIAFNIFYMLAVLSLTGALVLTILRQFVPSLDNALIKTIAFIALLSFTAFYTLAALYMFVIAIVFAAQGNGAPYFFIEPFLMMAVAVLAVALYFYLFGDDVVFVFKGKVKKEVTAEEAPKKERKPRGKGKKEEAEPAE